MKASDIRMMHRRMERAPFTKQSGRMLDLPISDPNDLRWKFNNKICPPCNNDLTQPYDMAWEKLSSYMFEKSPALKPGDIVDPTVVFRRDAEQQMLNVHLYFVKLFGCHVADLEIPIPLEPLAECLKHRRPQPNIHLRLAYAPENEHYLGDRNEVKGQRTLDGKMAAIWMYCISHIGMTVFFEEIGGHYGVLKEYWHPQDGIRPLDIVDCSKYLKSKPSGENAA